MSRRNLGTSGGRKGKPVDKSAMERMIRRERAMRKKRRKEKSISLAAMVSKNVIALATSLHGIGPLIQDGTFRKRMPEIEPAWHPPKGFSLVPIQMPNFSMELLLHQNEFYAEEMGQNQEVKEKSLRSNSDSTSNLDASRNRTSNINLASSGKSDLNNDLKSSNDSGLNNRLDSNNNFHLNASFNLDNNLNLNDRLSGLKIGRNHISESKKNNEDNKDTAERLLTENREVVLQLHGGGYIGKMKNAYRDFAVLYAKMPGERAVLSVDYRVAPEDPYPAALEDAYAAYQWLLEMGCEGNQIIVAGDSAGGGLALALCLYLKDKGESLPKKLVLMSPWTDLAATGDSYETNFEKDPLFGNTTDSMIYSNAYYGENDPKMPYISPLYGDYEGLPPMLFQVGGAEMLLSDSARAAKKAKAAGCEVKLTIYDGMFHVFQLGMKKMKESREAWKEIEGFVSD